MNNPWGVEWKTAHCRSPALRLESVRLRLHRFWFLGSCRSETSEPSLSPCHQAAICLGWCAWWSPLGRPFAPELWRLLLFLFNHHDSFNCKWHWQFWFDDMKRVWKHVSQRSVQGPSMTNLINSYRPKPWTIVNDVNPRTEPMPSGRCIIQIFICLADVFTQLGWQPKSGLKAFANVPPGNGTAQPCLVPLLAKGWQLRNQITKFTEKSVAHAWNNPNISPPHVDLAGCPCRSPGWMPSVPPQDSPSSIDFPICLVQNGDSTCRWQWRPALREEASEICHVPKCPGQSWW